MSVGNRRAAFEERARKMRERMEAKQNREANKLFHVPTTPGQREYQGKIPTAIVARLTFLRDSMSPEAFARKLNRYAAALGVQRHAIYMRIRRYEDTHAINWKVFSVRSSWDRTIRFMELGIIGNGARRTPKRFTGDQ